MDDTPEPERVLADLAGLVPIAYGALEIGVYDARRYFELRRDAFEPHLFSAIVRHSAKKHFETHRIRAEFELLDLPNNGLFVVWDGYRIRVRKAYRGSVGVPGSLSMIQFHAQELPLGFAEPLKPNLFLIWDVYKPSYLLAPDLFVACPRRNTARFPDSADMRWQRILPGVAMFPGEPVEADGFGEYEDLPIRKPGEKAEGGDDAT